MHLELQFEGALQVHGLVQMGLPPLVDLCHQLAADARRVLLGVGPLEPDKGGVGITVDHIVATRLDQGPGLAHDLVAAHGDRRRQARVEETATAGTSTP